MHGTHARWRQMEELRATCQAERDEVEALRAAVDKGKAELEEQHCALETQLCEKSREIDVQR